MRSRGSPMCVCAWTADTHAPLPCCCCCCSVLLLQAGAGAAQSVGGL
jgi:hypothetical protein